jgi:hypothetical protein
MKGQIDLLLSEYLLGESNALQSSDHIDVQGDFYASRKTLSFS